MKGNDNTKFMELMCAAVDIKEKMRALYAEAAGKCSDEVGSGTFKMLEELEKAHLDRLRKISEGASGGGEVSFDSCRFYDFETPDRKEVIRRIAGQRKTVSRACLDDIAAIESGMELENKSIEFFIAQLKKAPEPATREFLNYLIAEEREHYIVLADLKFYYIDPEHWFMEKGRTELDGAGGVS